MVFRRNRAEGASKRCVLIFKIPALHVVVTFNINEKEGKGQTFKTNLELQWNPAKILL